MVSPNPARFQPSPRAGGRSASTPAPTSIRASTGDCRPRSPASRGDSPSSSIRPAGAGWQCGGHRRADPAGLSQEQHRYCCHRRRPHPAERGAQCDQRHGQDRRPEGQNDPAAMVLAVGAPKRWPSRTRPGSTTKVAGRPLPVFRNVVEAVTYAMFPALRPFSCHQRPRDHGRLQGLRRCWDLDPALAPALRHPQLHGLDLRGLRSSGRGGGGPGTWRWALQTASSTIYSRAISGEAVVGYL